MEEKWLKKLHTAGRLKELRVQGITKRWVINILGVIALFFVIVFVVSAFTIRAYYYNAVESILNSGASTTATNYFSGRLDGGSSLEASAADFIDSFSYRDKTTIWIINNAGGVVTSSSGFAVEKVRMPDYEEALAGDTDPKWQPCSLPGRRAPTPGQRIHRRSAPSRPHPPHPKTWPERQPVALAASSPTPQSHAPGHR